MGRLLSDILRPLFVRLEALGQKAAQGLHLSLQVGFRVEGLGFRV